MGPQNYVPVVRQASTKGTGGAAVHDKLASDDVAISREVCAMRWGLVPSFAKRREDYDAFKGGSSTFNARVEGAESSGLWRRLLDGKRGVVLFDGFYEWKTTAKGKVPMFIRNRDDFKGHVIPMKAGMESPLTGTPKPGDIELPIADGGGEDAGPAHAPLLLAALYDVWHPTGSDKDKTSEEPQGERPQSQHLLAEEAEGLETATILTMDPTGTPMENVHDRMPVFLTPEMAARWLDGSERFSELIGPVLQASRTHARNDLLLYEVSTLVSNIRNESPDCILPKTEYDSRQVANGIGRFFKRKAPEPTGPSTVKETEATCATLAPPEKRAASDAAKAGGEVLLID